MSSTEDRDLGANALVLLPGALVEPSPDLLQRLGAARRVLALSYPDASRMTDLTDAIAAQLGAAGIQRADVLGSSYGGRVAQCLARRHPRLVRHLVLVHTFALRAADAWRFRLGLKLYRAIPGALLQRLLSLRVRRLPGVLREAAPAEYRRLEATLGSALRSPATIAALRSQNECMLESCTSFAATAADLSQRHRVLIVESDDDPAIRAADRARLRASLPGAVVKTFHGTGHVTALAAPEAFVAAVDAFLGAAD